MAIQVDVKRAVSKALDDSAAATKEAEDQLLKSLFDEGVTDQDRLNVYTLLLAFNRGRQFARESLAQL